VITELVIKKGKEKAEITEEMTFTIPALAWADTEAGKAEAAIEEALTAAETAVTEGMENAKSLTIMNTEAGLAVDADLADAAAAIKTAVEALIEDENITVTVTAKVTTAVNGDTAGAFTATVTLTYGDEADGNTKDVTLTGVIEKYVAAT
jgi:Flp pilus assembly protein TadG